MRYVECGQRHSAGVVRELKVGPNKEPKKGLEILIYKREDAQNKGHKHDSPLSKELFYKISVRLLGGLEASLDQWVQVTEIQFLLQSVSQVGVISVQMGVRSQSLEELNRTNI